MPTFLAIDLKSFYASVECVERGLNPLQTNLVVADRSRTDKTICLAVSPSLKSYGIGGRARLFEVVRRVQEVNRDRLYHSPRGILTGTSTHNPDIEANPEVELDYIVAPPRMSLYMKYSARVYEVYLRHIAPEDIHVYSVDEVFIDATRYLQLYRCSAHELAMRLIREVLAETGVTATAGIGTNLYLAKVAMDIVAKHIPADADGVRIAELDERSYRQQLWGHTPLTDFWRVGRGIARRLQAAGMTTMGDVARRSIADEEWFYRQFGVTAELIIDHAWGWEPCTMQAIKSYRSQSNSLSSGQVLTEPYSAERARVVVREMADAVALDLVDKRLVADLMTLDIGYEPLHDASGYDGELVYDHYGRLVPRPAHGSARLQGFTSSSHEITEAVCGIFDRVVNRALQIRRMVIGTCHVVPESRVEAAPAVVQLDLFTDYEALAREQQAQQARRERERKLQETQLSIRKKFGKNALLRGTNFEDGATQRQRNQQIGGHRE